MMLAVQHQMLVQQQAALQGQCDIIKRLFNQIEQMPKRGDTQGEEISLHDLHEKTGALLEYCKNIVTNIITIPGVHSATNVEVDTDPIPDGWTSTC